MSTIELVEKAAQTYWNTDTSGRGHLSRGKAFFSAREELIFQGYKKGEAQKIIAASVQENAPAHEKKFGAATVAHYVASFSLMGEEESNFAPTAAHVDLYTVLHKAYAASMGVENLRNVLKSYTDVSAAMEAIQNLSRPGSDAEGEEGEKPKRGYGLKNALNALAKIQEWEWTEDEKTQLFTAALATSVAVQPED